MENFPVISETENSIQRMFRTAAENGDFVQVSTVALLVRSWMLSESDDNVSMAIPEAVETEILFAIYQRFVAEVNNPVVFDRQFVSIPLGQDSFIFVEALKYAEEAVMQWTLYTTDSVLRLRWAQRQFTEKTTRFSPKNKLMRYLKPQLPKWTILLFLITSSLSGAIVSLLIKASWDVFLAGQAFAVVWSVLTFYAIRFIMKLVNRS